MKGQFAAAFAENVWHKTIKGLILKASPAKPKSEQKIIAGPKRGQSKCQHQQSAMQARSAEQEEVIPLSDDEFLPVSEADSFDAERDMQDAFDTEFEWEQNAHRQLAAPDRIKPAESLSFDIDNKLKVPTIREIVQTLLVCVSEWQTAAKQSNQL